MVKCRYGKLKNSVGQRVCKKLKKVRKPVKFIDRIKHISNVEDAHYNSSNLSLAVYYKQGAYLGKIKGEVLNIIDMANLHTAVEKINFYSV